MIFTNESVLLGILRYEAIMQMRTSSALNKKVQFQTREKRKVMEASAILRASINMYKNFLRGLLKKPNRMCKKVLYPQASHRA